MGWVLHALILLLGIGIGYFLARRNPAEERVKEMEEHLRSLQNKYDLYQQQVTEHFSRSAQLVNNLTQQYRLVHDHLRHGADQLCMDTRRHGKDNPSKAFTTLGHGPITSSESPADPVFLASVAPPRDYADKHPQDKGTLDDDFGLK